MYYGHAYRSGEIVFSEKPTVSGAIQIGSGVRDEFPEKVRVRARRGYDGELLLVPGLPGAETEREAEAALDRFIEFLAH